MKHLVKKGNFNKVSRNKFILIKTIFKPFNKLVNLVLKIGNLFIIWRNGKAIGDQVMMAGLARILRLKYNSKIIVITNYPNLLELSPWISKSISPRQIKGWFFLYYLLKLFEGQRVIEYNFPYKLFGYNNHLEAYRSGFYEKLNKPAIWHAHVADRFNSDFFANYVGGLERSRCKIVEKLIEDTRKNFSSHKIGIINPVGKETYTKSKLFGFDNYQHIVNLTSNKIKWFQVGLAEDKVLKNLRGDCRGNSLEFLVNLVSFSDLVLADEGLLNHIAGSFPNVNSYVTFSEFSPINYYSYKNTTTVGIPKKKEIYYWGKDPVKNSYKINTAKQISKLILNKEFLE